MKVILRADVENLGRLGDLVDVKPGYGRNFLLPQGFAMLATPSNIKVFELEKKKLQVKVEAERSQAASLSDRIEKTPITISMRVGENDKLYGSVTSALIAEAMEAQGLDIDRRRILLDAPIRALGEYKVRIRLHANVIAELPLTVAAEKTVFEDEQPVQEEAAAEVVNAEEQSAPAEESTE